MKKITTNISERSLANLRPWQPGQSGNPLGRPKTPEAVKKAYKEHSLEAMDRLVALMRSEDERIALEASRYITDRAFGRPTEKIAGDEDGTPIIVQQPSEAQMAALAAKVLGEDAEKTNDSGVN